MVDIRIPIGLMFSIFGVLITVLVFLQLPTTLCIRDRWGSM